MITLTNDENYFVMKTEQEKILQTAIKEIRINGYQDMKLTKIANSLKITHTTIYKYYPDKEGLKRAVIYFEMETQLENLKRSLQHRQLSLNDAIYKFLWMLARIQKEYCTGDPELFLLMKHEYISNSTFREEQNSSYFKLLRKILEGKHVVGDTTRFAENILKTFVTFFAPYFSYEWYSDYYQAKFDALFNFAILNNSELHNGSQCAESSQVKII